MADSKDKRKSTGRSQSRESNVSLYPLTPEQAIKGILQISKEDAKRVVASKPGKGKKPNEGK